MKFTPPKNMTWWIALILGVLGLFGFMGVVAGPTQYAFWLVAAGLALLLVACLVRNLTVLGHGPRGRKAVRVAPGSMPGMFGSTIKAILQSSAYR